uniref:FSD2 n=1 Tax=Arundo donax TaxID=35708 RepID=A0A0A8XMY7_ARUDO
MVESRLKKAVVQAIERDGHISRRHLRKQLLARAKGQSSRARSQQGRPAARRGDQEVACIGPMEA